jgi:uncharacterized RDD family membrane protein YckC
MQSVEIKTTQNVVIEHELASVGSRILAWVIDTVLLGLFIWIHAIIYLSTFKGMPENLAVLYTLIVYLTLVFLLYNPVCEIYFNGQTLGKRLLNIRVIKLDRSRSDFQSFLIRGVFRMVDINLCAGTLAFIFISSSPKRQRLGDLLAHTAVVKTESRINLALDDLMKIDSIENYTPNFPQVKRLTDEEIITIRQLLDRYRKYPNKAHHEALKEIVMKLCMVLEIDKPNTSAEVFLRNLVKDYIVLTR